jgi:hypothetical protein
MSADAEGVTLSTVLLIAANDVVRMLKTQDGVTVTGFDTGMDFIQATPTRLLDAVPAMIESVGTGYGKADVLQAVFEASKSIEKSLTIHKEIYLFTDKDGADLSQSGKIKLPENTHLFVFPIERGSDVNIGITEVELPGQLVEVGRPVEFQAKVKNYSSLGISETPISLFIDDVRTSQTGISFSSGQEIKPVSLSAQIDRGGIHTGRFESPSDLIPVDNSRYFTFRVPDKLRVLLVGERTRTQFLSLALSSGSKTYFDIKQTGYASLSSELLNDVDVIVIESLRPLSDTFRARLTRFLEQGGGAMFWGIDSASLSDPSLKSLLSSLAGISAESYIGSSDRSSYVGIGKADFNNGIFSVFSASGVPPVRFNHVLQSASSRGVILSYSNGMPAVVEAPVGEGRIVFLSFSLNWADSDILTGGFFVPFAHRSIQYLAGEMARFDQSFTVGDDVLRIVTNVPQSSRVFLEKPDKSKTYLTPRFSQGKASLNIGIVRQPGIYSLYADSILIDAFAVNIDAEGSEVNPLTYEKLSEKIDGNKPIFIDPLSGDIEEKILLARYGKELRKLCLYLALLLMIIELILETIWRESKSSDIKDDFK